MVFKNARIFCADMRFHSGAFEVKEGVFGEILCREIPEDAVDLGGATVIPGLVDIHIHGAVGADVSDGDAAANVAMAKHLASRGITSFVPATMTLPYEQLQKALAAAREVAEHRPEGAARLLGIHMEGPYFCEKKKGAQNGAYLKDPDFEGFQKLYENCGGLIRIVDVAPELPGAVEFVEKAKDLCTVSIAHTDSDYDHAKAAIDAGITHLTHLYNAMPPVHHRDPGVIPAAVENPNVRAEIICDGLHIHPSSVRLAFTMFGGERMIVVSDSGRGAGQPDGTSFELGGQIATLIGGVARLSDGTIACSASDMGQCLVNCVSWGIREEDAVRACTYNPACAIGADKLVGSIETGKIADFLVCSPDYTQRRVFLAGQEQ